MNALRTSRLFYSLLVGLALTVGGCGDEYDPSHASGGPPVPPLEDLAFKNPAETTVTSLDLTASAEYVPPATNGGCPLVDDPDSDGVFDVADLCPNQSGPAANDGCPLAERLQHHLLRHPPRAHGAHARVRIGRGGLQGRGPDRLPGRSGERPRRTGADRAGDRLRGEACPVL